jgi:hypothetical protein
MAFLVRAGVPLYRAQLEAHAPQLAELTDATAA